MGVRHGQGCREGGLGETAPKGVRVELVCDRGGHYDVLADTYTPSRPSHVTVTGKGGQGPRGADR